MAIIYGFGGQNCSQPLSSCVKSSCCEQGDRGFSCMMHVGHIYHQCRESGVHCLDTTEWICPAWNEPGQGADKAPVVARATRPLAHNATPLIVIKQEHSGSTWFHALLTQLPGAIRGGIRGGIQLAKEFDNGLHTISEGQLAEAIVAGTDCFADPAGRALAACGFTMGMVQGS